MRPPICDKTAPPHLENPGSATGDVISNRIVLPGPEQDQLLLLVPGRNGITWTEVLLQKYVILAFLLLIVNIQWNFSLKVKIKYYMKVFQSKTNHLPIGRREAGSPSKQVLTVPGGGEVPK